MEPGPSALGARSLHYWTMREVINALLLMDIISEYQDFMNCVINQWTSNFPNRNVEIISVSLSTVLLQKRPYLF